MSKMRRANWIALAEIAFLTALPTALAICGRLIEEAL